jgi:hypothetical protein
MSVCWVFWIAELCSAQDLPRIACRTQFDVPNATSLPNCDHMPFLCARQHFSDQKKTADAGASTVSLW